MILLPRAAETVSAPPLMTVPGAAVVIVPTWHRAQPIWLKRLLPAITSELLTSVASRGGTLRDRMNRAKESMSRKFAGKGGLGRSLSSGSATVSHKVVTSVGLNRFVIPIS